MQNVHVHVSACDTVGSSPLSILHVHVSAAVSRNCVWGKHSREEMVEGVSQIQILHLFFETA